VEFRCHATSRNKVFFANSVPSFAENVLGLARPAIADGTGNHSGYSPLNVPYLRRRRAALALCRYGAQVRKLRWPGELSVRLAVYGPPLRTALVVGDVIALTAFERCLASWNVLLCIASGAGNRLHPLRYSRRYEYGRQNT